MSAVRVLIVDDEPEARAGIAALCAEDPELVVVGECADGRDAVEAIRRLAPDLVLLDVRMPELDGFEVVREVGPERMPVVVFVTAYDQHAIRAFEANAVDYLLKPFDDARFRAAIARARRSLRGARAEQLRERVLALLDGRGVPASAEPASPPAAPHLARIVVKSAGRVFFVRVEEIDWIEAADYYARLHVGGRSHLVRETMSALEQRLDPARFFRVHRSAIVNLDRVREVQRAFGGEHVVLVRDGARLPLSRSRIARLETLMGQSL